MLKKFALLSGLLFVAISGRASVHETLPSWHWSIECIDELRLRGGFTELFSLTRPFTRGQIAEGLISIRKAEMDGKLMLTASDKKMFFLLIKEFKAEIEEIQKKEDGLEIVKLGVHAQGNVNGNNGDDTKYKGIYRSKIGVPLGKFGCAYNGIAFNQYLIDDPSYMGKKWRGIVGYTEQAYVRLAADRFSFTFGRDFLRWGAGRTGSLLFSDIARPMDQFSASAGLGPFRYSIVVSALDAWNFSPALADSLGNSRANRYLSAHRLDVRLLRGRFQAGVSELVFYGGVNRQMDWSYLNPAVFFHGESMNSQDAANTLGMLDFQFYPADRFELYGSLLIDDLQIEKTGPGDLEPAEVGWIIGSRIADPGSLSGTTLFGEYVRVTNRTYKTPNPWETFIHRNVPLGYPLGNDFDLFEIGFSKWIHGNIQMKVNYDAIRKGEGSLYAPFDTPWIHADVEQGYSEPFPTGVAEKQQCIGVSLRYFPSTHVGIEGEFTSIKSENAGHIRNRTRNQTFWRIGIWVDGDWFINVKRKE